EDTLQKRRSALIAIAFFNRLHRAEFQPRRTTGVFRRHARTDVVLCLHIDVEPEFFRQIRITPSAGKCAGKPLDRSPHEFHSVSASKMLDSNRRLAPLLLESKIKVPAAESFT